MTAKTKRRESDLYRPALQFLNTRPGTKAWLIHNNAIFFPASSGGFWKRKKNHEDGVPDICGVKLKASGRLKYGQAFAFEVKMPGEKATPEQLDWLRRFAECGGIGWVVDSLQDIQDAWKDV